MARRPVIFLGHGAPSLAIDAGKGAPLRAWGASLPRPRAALVISAHWETRIPPLGATSRLPLIHDYSGFPPELGEVRYPSPGAPDLATRVAELLAPGVDRAPGRGLDHGVWAPLVHLWPEADVPVLQLSLPRDGRFDLGRRLAPTSSGTTPAPSTGRCSSPCWAPWIRGSRSGSRSKASNTGA